MPKRNMGNAVDITIRHINALIKFLDKSELNKIARSFEFLDDAEDVAHDLVSTNPAARHWAAQRLAEITVLPSPSKRPKNYLKNLRAHAKAAQMTPAAYVEKILIPGGIILAAAEMDSLQYVKPGKKWITGRDGKKKLVRPARDLTVVQFIRWAFQKGNRHVLNVLLDQTDSKDALNTDRKKAGKKKKERTEGPSDDWTAIPQRELQQEFHKLTGDYAEDSMDRAKIDEFVAIQRAKGYFDDLRTRASLKDQELLDEVIKNDGKLVDTLRELGYQDATIRQKKRRLKKI